MPDRTFERCWHCGEEGHSRTPGESKSRKAQCHACTILLTEHNGLPTDYQGRTRSVPNRAFAKQHASQSRVCLQPRNPPAQSMMRPKKGSAPFSTAHVSRARPKKPSRACRMMTLTSGTSRVQMKKPSPTFPRRVHHVQVVQLLLPVQEPGQPPSSIQSPSAPPERLG